MRLPGTSSNKDGFILTNEGEHTCQRKKKREREKSFVGSRRELTGKKENKIKKRNGRKEMENTV